MRMISIQTALELTGFKSPAAFHAWCDLVSNKRPIFPVNRHGGRVDVDSVQNAMAHFGWNRPLNNQPPKPPPRGCTGVRRNFAPISRATTYKASIS